MNKYYLDTNAVRRIGRNLSKYADSSFTSAFVILELLSGLTESDYKFRKGALRHLLASGVPIDKRLPIDVALASFGLHAREDAITYDDLKAVADALIASADYADFMQRNRNLQPDINLLKFVDQRLSAQFRKVFSEKTHDIRVARLTDEVAKFNADPKKGVLGIAKFIFGSFQMRSGISSPSDLAHHYNGSIDRFLQSWQGYYDINANELSEAGKNDWSDLLHLNYLESDEARILVTDDKGIGGLVNTFVPGSWSLVDDFVRKSTIQE